LYIERREKREERKRREKEIGSDLTGSLSFRCKYVFTMLLFSRENDRFFCTLKKCVSCFDDASRE
jgi:hypothetical protein